MTNGDEFEKLNVGDHYWHNGELLEKHWYDTTSVVEAPTPESAPKSPLSFVAFIVVVVILFLLIWTLRHAGSNDSKEDPPINYALLKNVKEPIENTNRSLTVVPREIVLIPDQDEILRIKREREAQIREQALERDRRLAEAEAALRETELREAARRETERQLAEAAAWDALFCPRRLKRICKHIVRCYVITSSI